MDQIIATVSINIGLEKGNPTLIIKRKDNIPKLVEKLIKDYNLPKNVYSVIIEGVQQQLSKTEEKQQKTKEFYNKTAHIPKKEASPNLVKKEVQKTNIICRGKENNQKTFNRTPRKSISPIKKVQKSPISKKVELRPSKSPIKKQNNARISIKTDSSSVKIKKLFKHLIKQNPPNMKILNPEYICFKGLDKKLLADLQNFFESIDQSDFEKIDQLTFIKKVQQMGYTSKLCKKQFDYCLIR